ncbi:type 1 secretion target domain protein [Vreelandella boliviensis LC1]|uniref:Type 1 secretion target domain protein n=1 Tax=Vreelandella boliviensis LC1 TaxID=1072583 RepID=A0ABX4G507_9GAMM|nr:type 1 secretion target domain protein [Halomonas boliviensis LC1]
MDTTDVSISAIVTKTSVINVGNVDNTDSFTVTASNPNSSEGTISKVTGTDHDGFGVVGSTSGGGANSELGYDNAGSESIVVNFNNEVKNFDVQFAWRNNNERAKVEFFDKDGNSVGSAIVSGGGTSTEALVTYYDANGDETRTERAPGGSDRVDNAYTFEPGSGDTFTSAEFTAVGYGDDYLIHSIAYKEVMNGEATSIGGASEVTFEIATSNRPDESQFDFIDTFPTATVNIGGQEYTVNLDRNGKGSVAVETDGESDLTAEVIEVNGNFEDVNVPTSLTLYKGNLETGNNGDNSIEAGQGNDIVLGDLGGAETNIQPGQSYNIALVVDTSGSMAFDLNGKENNVSYNDSRMKLTIDALKNLSNQLAEHDGMVNVTLIGFAENATGWSFNNLTSANVKDLIDEIEDLTASGGTNYEAAFEKASDWFGGQPTSDSNDNSFENLTYFLTDGDPTFSNNGDNGKGWETEPRDMSDAIKAFAPLSEQSSVHAIGIGDKVTVSNLKYFDNTGEQSFVKAPFGIESEVLADFNNGSGWGNANSWDKPSSGGSLGRGGWEGNRMVVTDTSANNGAYVVTTPTFEIGAGKYADVSFDYATTTWSSDQVTWQLKKLESGSWVNVDGQGGTLNDGSYSTWYTATSSRLGEGSYRIEYSVDDSSGSYYDATLYIDNVKLTPYVPQGEVEIVNSAGELAAALDGGSSTTELAELGDDVIKGGDGNDIIFGDAIYTDDLDWTGRDWTDLPAGSGFKALKAFLEDRDGQEPTTEQLREYIADNYEDLIDPDPAEGGDDTLIGGAGDDILIGGLGADIFKWEFGDEGTDTNAANDVVKDFQAGTFSTGDNADRLDLSDLLQGADSGNINEYITAEEDDGNVVLNISSRGSAGGVDQKIALEDTSFNDFGANSGEDLIAKLIAEGQLKIDQ